MASFIVHENLKNVFFVFRCSSCYFEICVRNFGRPLQCTGNVIVKKKTGNSSQKLGGKELLQPVQPPTPHASHIPARPRIGAAALPDLPHPNRLRHRPDPRGAVPDRRAAATDRAPPSGSRDTRRETSALAPFGKEGGGYGEGAS